MRLVVVTNSFHPREGGAERQLRHVGAVLATDHGWEVAVVTRHVDGVPSREQIEGIAVHRVGRPASGRRALLPGIAIAARTTAALRADVIVAVQLGTAAAAAVVASRLTARPRPPVVLRLAGGLADGTELERRGRAWWWRPLVGRLLADCRVIVAPARHLLDRPGHFGALVGARGIVIPNGARVPEPTGEPRSAVLWVGRFDPVKRLDRFLAVAARNPEREHVVVGPAPTDLPPDAPANVRATGWLPDPAPELARAAVVVSTSDFEGHPNAAVEALQAGVPVVAWDIAAFRELAGTVDALVHLVPPGDVETMAAVVRVVADGGDTDARRVPGSLPTIADAAARWDGVLRGLVPVAPAPTEVGARG